MANSPEFFIVLSACIFAIGLTGLVIRRNPLVMFMSIELMLNAANIAFVTFGRFAQKTTGYLGGPSDGAAFSFIVMTIAAAEAVIGLAIIITIFRKRHTVDVDQVAGMKG